MPTSKFIVILLSVCAGIFVLILSFYPFHTTKTAHQNTKALIGGPFTLIDTHGTPVTQKNFQGKYMLIYFGYTYCPDICPMELQAMTDALDQLPDDVLSEITPIFITTDPDRDTTSVLSQYVSAFHPKLIGLTGSQEQITAVKKAYRVYAAKEKQAEGADPATYLMSHTSYIYLMDREGQYVTHFRSQTDPAEMAKRLKEIIK